LSSSQVGSGESHEAQATRKARKPTDPNLEAKKAPKRALKSLKEPFKKEWIPFCLDYYPKGPQNGSKRRPNIV